MIHDMPYHLEINTLPEKTEVSSLNYFMIFNLDIRLNSTFFIRSVHMYFLH